MSTVGSMCVRLPLLNPVCGNSAPWDTPQDSNVDPSTLRFLFFFPYFQTIVVHVSPPPVGGNLLLRPMKSI